MRSDEALRPHGPNIQTGKNAGIARIMMPNGQTHAGMGIVVSRTRIVTCAHVVNIALGRAAESLVEPAAEETIAVRFPLQPDKASLQAKVIAWKPVGDQAADDIAVLETVSEVPATVGVAICADVTRRPLDGNALSVFGFASGQRFGNHIDARFMGANNAAWVQIDGASAAGTFIQGGFSGGGVWDIMHGAVVGMVVARNTAPDQRVAYMIPVRDIRRAFPDLPYERNDLRESFGAIWTVCAGVFFLLMLNHWLEDRGNEALLNLAFARDHLAAFAGMHAYGFFAWLPALLLLRHASAFRLHPWRDRVPSFGSFGKARRSASLGFTALLSLAAFMVLPMAAQVHFLRQFHDKGTVYVYKDLFYPEGTPPWEGCIVDSVHKCPADGLDRYSLATPIGGAEGGYWNNAYHFGKDVREGQDTVTYFPILQPLVVIALTILGVILSGFALFRVFRNPSSPTS